MEAPSGQTTEQPSEIEQQQQQQQYQQQQVQAEGEQEKIPQVVVQPKHVKHFFQSTDLEDGKQRYECMLEIEKSNMTRLEPTDEPNEVHKCTQNYRLSKSTGFNKLLVHVRQYHPSVYEKVYLSLKNTPQELQKTPGKKRQRKSQAKSKKSFKTHHDTYRAIRYELDQVFDKINSDEIETVCRSISGSNNIFVYGVGREGLCMKAFGMRLFHLGYKSYVVGEMTTPAIGPGDLLIVSAGPGSFSTVVALIGETRMAGGQVLCITSKPDIASTLEPDWVLTLPAQTMAIRRDAPVEQPVPITAADPAPVGEQQYMHSAQIAEQPAPMELGVQHMEMVEQSSKYVEQQQAEQAHGEEQQQVGQFLQVEGEHPVVTVVDDSVLPLGSLYELTLWTTLDLIGATLAQRCKVDATTMATRHTNLE